MKLRIFLCIVLTCLLAGCAPETAPEQTTASTVAATEPVPADSAPTEAPQAEEVIPTATVPETEFVEEEFAALAEPEPVAEAFVLEPEAPGIAEQRSDDAVIDYSNAAEGYVMVQYMTENPPRLKVQVKGPRTTYTYNLPQGEWTVFPLSDGNGYYQVCVYENVYDNKYALALSANFQVDLEDEFAPFLRPNQYVNYSAATEAVAKGLEVTAGLTDPLEKVAAVYDFVVTTLSYDHEKAATVKSGYLPVLDEILELEKGICFDYAALMTAMLRSQNIPTKLVVGYAGSTYHAWISVWTEENGWVDGAIFFDGQVWKRMDPTFASSGNRSDEIMDYIEHGNYVDKYLY